MSKRPQVTPRTRSADNPSDHCDQEVRLILDDTGQLLVGLQGRNHPEEVLLTIEDIAAIAATLDRYQQDPGIAIQSATTHSSINSS